MVLLVAIQAGVDVRGDRLPVSVLERPKRRLLIPGDHEPPLGPLEPLLHDDRAGASGAWEEAESRVKSRPAAEEIVLREAQTAGLRRR